MTAGALTAYSLHGYVLETDVPLPGYPPAPAGSAAVAGDVLRLVHCPPRPPDRTLEPGEVLAELVDPARRQVYRFTRSAEELVLRFGSTADVVTDPLLRSGVARAWPGVDPAVLSVLVPGTVLAARLILDGRLALHASAFQVGSCAVAVVGGSGMGKSTLGALAVLAGHPLVSDDVLRVDLDGDPVVVWPGAAESRLRRSARDVVPHFAASGTVRTTADGRTAVAGAQPVGATPDPAAAMPLACCVVPFPRRDVTAVSLRRLGAFEALRRLSGFPRVLGWRDTVTSAQQFHLLADLCERVPVVEAAVPWGPPFDPDVIPQLVAALDLG